MQLIQQVPWSAVFVLAWAAVGLYAAGHALTSKTDPRAAWGWIAVCWLFPFAGPALYFVFGINRIQSRAHRIGFTTQRSGALEAERDDDLHYDDAAEVTLSHVARSISVTGDRLTRLPLVSGNRFKPLHNGEEAYPAMLAAIDSARQWIALTTYIFDNDDVGQTFVAALQRAHARHVDVRVLVDGVGERYSFRRISPVLRKAGIQAAVFNPLRLFPPALHLNLRNHRKLLLVDGEIGFTGGINIGQRHVASADGTAHVARDLHFQVEGPVLQQLLQTFQQDWLQCTGNLWQAPSLIAGASLVPDGVVSRIITDGPNEDYDHLSLIMRSAVSAARQRISIVTPYFLPPAELIADLQAASLRGVDVQVLLPSKNNLPFVHWATLHMLWQLTQYGARVYYQPGSFDHSKLFVIDTEYALIGSANIDARSLKLNFELGVEIYDHAFAQKLQSYFDERRNVSTLWSQDEQRRRSLLVRLRNALMWLFSPYL